MVFECTVPAFGVRLLGSPAFGVLAANACPEVRADQGVGLRTRASAPPSNSMRLRAWGAVVASKVFINSAAKESPHAPALRPHSAW